MAKRVISAVLELKDQSFTSGMKRAGRNLSDLDRQSMRVGNTVEKMSKKAVSGFKMVSTAAAGLATGGIVALGAGIAKTMLDMDKSFATLQAQTGTSVADFGALKESAIETFSKGYGASLDEVTSALSRVKQNMEGLDGGEIGNVTTKAMLLAQTFDSDVNEVTRGVSNAMQAFGVSADKAFDLFTAGGQRGLNFSNEMFDNVAEFAGLYGAMGYSAEEYFGIMERGAQSGVYNLSYVNDLMKEFQIMTKDGSKRTNEAMGSMSKATQSVWKEFLKGNGTVKDVASTVVNELKGMDNQVKAGQLGVELFGVKWEDMEADAVYAMLGTTNALKDFEGTTNTVAAAVERTFGNRMKSAWRDLQTSIAQSTSDGTGKEFMETLAFTAERAVPAITSFAKKAMEFGLVIRDNWTPIKETVFALGSGILATAVAFKTLSVAMVVTKALQGTTTVMGAATVAMHGLNTAIRANPIGAAATAIGLLVVGGVALYRNWDTMKVKAVELWAVIQEKFAGIKASVSDFVQPAISWFGSLKTKWDNFTSSITNFKMPEWISTIGSTVSSAASKFKNFLPSFEVGTDHVKTDMVAQIHKGEMIIPAREAERVRQSGGNINNISGMIDKPTQVIQNVSNGSNSKGVNTIHIQFGDIHADQLKYEDVIGRLSNDIKLALANM